ncbi:DNA polymerase IV [Alkalicella caledoniensis]|uniref:DNA polymerase IV n=1 Tax=Alkalicella caledoniensis TaxID=2731377 RepID=A0A7G9WAH0_ALKCA|nr:DNA polymerase IV [Alkalicella caledoniensis]QNO15682.1 DNA polymerase IV [Alkalicella caledoniensis]
MEKWILHVDMDAFFAAVEKRDNPTLKDKPVIVGGHPHKYPRGVVSTCCYEARKYGVRSAMSTYEALKRCPGGVFVLPQQDKYTEVSREIIKVFSQYTPLVEPISIDEAFLDVSGCEKLFGSPSNIAEGIQRKIFEVTSLTCSIGIAQNKFLAKLASDLNKPNGITFINPNEIEKTLDPLPVSKIWGIGPKQQKKLYDIGVKTIGNLKRLSVEQLTPLFGINAPKLWNLSRGIDDRVVETETVIKSISNEQTFMEDIEDIDILKHYLVFLTDKVSRRMRNQNIKGKTITLKLKFSDFTTSTSQTTLDVPVNLPSEIFNIALPLLKGGTKKRRVRLLGVGVSNLSLDGSGEQMSLFEDTSSKEKEKKLQGSIDNILEKFGDKALYRASSKKNY